MVKARKKQEKLVIEEIPIPDGAVRTSQKMCRRCRYSTTISGNYNVCYYISYTKKHRGCPVGWCDKYEPKRRKRRTKK